jgi:hypothetical protein
VFTDQSTKDIMDISSFIDTGKYNSLTLDNTTLMSQKEDIIFPASNILRDKYRGVILQNCMEVTVTSDELYRKFAYKPKALSYTLYGTTELWHLLLWINNMSSTSQFNKRRFLIFLPTSSYILQKIINREQAKIDANKLTPDEIVAEATTIYRR